MADVESKPAAKPRFLIELYFKGQLIIIATQSLTFTAP